MWRGFSLSWKVFFTVVHKPDKASRDRGTTSWRYVYDLVVNRILEEKNSGGKVVASNRFMYNGSNPVRESGGSRLAVSGWRILVNGSISLYHDENILKEDMQWLKDAGYQLYLFDFRLIRTSEEFHKKVKEELRFPDYYGENISAFSDCLMFDLPIPEDGGVAIVLKGFDEFYRTDEDYAHEILERLDTNVSCFWSERLFKLPMKGW